MSHKQLGAQSRALCWESSEVVIKAVQICEIPGEQLQRENKLGPFNGWLEVEEPAKQKEKSAVREVGVKTRWCGIMESKGRNVKSINKRKKNFQQYKSVLRGEVK